MAEKINLEQNRFGFLVASHLEHKGISQPELAHKLHIVPGAVSGWVRGRCFPGLPMFIDVLDYLDMTPDQFFQIRHDNPKPITKIEYVEKLVEVEKPANPEDQTEWLKDDGGIWFCKRCRADAPYDKTGFQRRTKVCPFCCRTVKHPKPTVALDGKEAKKDG